MVEMDCNNQDDDNNDSCVYLNSWFHNLGIPLSIDWKLLYSEGFLPCENVKEFFCFVLFCFHFSSKAQKFMVKWII